ncbi:DUF2635 domain-containing protein [Neisseria shayeganii]|uniref:DUF2635 domain-containing protein n=1 Tax=Neisseria shayeganii TaxID=607712 RepID=A0A7D7NB07_9NEIS|nr:DUF2635 domain-containing protein [Neisseria shayeganii]QMT39996.1 DUF2635 domain-containing protein [Neisseria shayeganii]
MSLLVQAAPGLKVPMDGQPHRYITDDTPVAVAETAYYLRCLDYGDLVRVTPEAAAPQKGAEKNGK